MINTTSPKPHIFMAQGQWVAYTPDGYRVVRTPWRKIAFRAAAKAYNPNTKESA